MGRQLGFEHMVDQALFELGEQALRDVKLPVRDVRAAPSRRTLANFHLVARAGEQAQFFHILRPYDQPAIGVSAR